MYYEQSIQCKKSDRCGIRQGRGWQILSHVHAGGGDAEVSYKVAILDADITGPSIPQAFGIRSKATGTDEGNHTGGFQDRYQGDFHQRAFEDTTDPVVWRGPVLSGVIDQFWNNVVWGDIDVMYVDMPPGTGDVALTVFQSLPLDGLVIVTSPQELVSMIVEKGSQNGAADERSGHRHRRESFLLYLSGLRREAQDLR